MGEVIPVDFSKASQEASSEASLDGKYDSLALIDPDSAAEANAQTAKWLIELSQRQE